MKRISGLAGNVNGSNITGRTGPKCYNFSVIAGCPRCEFVFHVGRAPTQHNIREVTVEYREGAPCSTRLFEARVAAANRTPSGRAHTMWAQSGERGSAFFLSYTLRI
jgi:hypothetical protein